VIEQALKTWTPVMLTSGEPGASWGNANPETSVALL